MTKLEELIKELCPNGVDNVELGEVLNYEQPQKYIVKDTNYDKSYRTPVLTAGQTFILGYTNEIEGIYCASKDNPVIIFDDFTTSFHWVDFDFKIKSSAMKMLRVKDTKKCLFKYIFYAMQTIKYVPYGHTRQWIENYSRLQIPLPPLAVQREIVQILDKFTLLSAELTAELTARRKQYEFYRDKLLDFNFTMIKVMWKSLGELGDFYGGLNGKTKSDFTNGNAKLITYKNVYLNSALRLDVEDTVIIEPNEKQNTLQYGDIIFTGSSETPEECGFSSVVTKETNEKLYLNSFCFFLRLHDSKILLPEFSKYLFRSNNLRIQICKTASGVTRYNVSKDKMKKVVIPVPPIDVQERIVKVLDNFDAICSDLEIGLPAEIEARQKQYEFYRDKLLNFKGKKI